MDLYAAAIWYALVILYHSRSTSVYNTVSWEDGKTYNNMLLILLYSAPVLFNSIAVSRYVKFTM